MSGKPLAASEEKHVNTAIDMSGDNEKENNQTFAIDWFHFYAKE